MAKIGPRGMIDRTEYLRILQQGLEQLGFQQIARDLEAASVRLGSLDLWLSFCQSGCSCVCSALDDMRPNPHANLVVQGVQMQSALVSQFQSHVMEAQWEEAMVDLGQLSKKPEVLREGRFLVRVRGRRPSGRFS
jgi:hypothetical protein